MDINKIKELTNTQISYSIYERNENKKMKNIKKITISLCMCLLVIGSGIGVNAASDGKLANNINAAISVLINGNEVDGETYTDENGDTWVKIKEGNFEMDVNQNTVKDNDLELECNIEEDGSEIKIK